MPRGVLHIASPEAYEQDRPDTATPEALELLATLAPFSIAPPPVPPPTDWLYITQAVRCGNRFSLQAQRPGWTVSIQFHDVPPFEGAYRVTVPSEHRDEQGSILSVEAIGGNRLVDHRHAMLLVV